MRILRKRSKFSPKQGDVWIVSEDGIKQRPVVVVSKEGRIVADIKEYITEDDLFSQEFDWFHVGLNRKSQIKLNKLYEVKSEHFYKKLGRIKKSDLYSLIKKIKAFITVGA